MVKWLKYFIIIGVCVLMIIINVGGEYNILLRIRYERSADTVLAVGGKSFGTASKWNAIGPRPNSTHDTRLHPACDGAFPSVGWLQQYSRCRREEQPVWDSRPHR